MVTVRRLTELPEDIGWIGGITDGSRHVFVGIPRWIAKFHPETWPSIQSDRLVLWPRDKIPLSRFYRAGFYECIWKRVHGQPRHHVYVEVR